ncbi:hypothetical protein LPMP_270600 [Leishmania panamensis]|uniref:Uncharacterized protein n=1 Tax=Leishmania panamensis TaxID=5679 RepID=A0A088RTF9_LEIPA|nr:hypothetical protein LPMP_270600 [Leishmania panamensis]AIN99442.1 hypothetical protein LPMP_270600 [Leishmania panamensis]
MVDYHLPALTATNGKKPIPSPKKKTDDHILCQEYAGYIAQLRGLLEETTGQPPAGVRTAEVERRIALIQSALEEVERLNANTRWRIEHDKAQRVLDTYKRRINAEEEAEKRLQDAEKQRTAQLEEARSLQLAYYKNRNDRIEAKAHQCRAHNEQMQEQTVMKASSKEERRTRNLANLDAERQRTQKELHDREQARQDYARKLRERQAAKDAQTLAEKARLAEIRRQEREAKLCAICESKRSKWMAKKEASSSKSVVVWKNGEAILETKLKDHNDLVEELEQRRLQQESRYAEEKAELEAYIQQRRQIHAVRQERQRENLRKLVDKRVTRGVEIVKAAEEKKERAEQAKERQVMQYVKAGKLLDESVRLHRERVQRLQDRRTNESLAQHYRRWNHRAARIMEELHDAMAEEETRIKAEAEQHGAAATNQRGSAAYADNQCSWGSGPHVAAPQHGYQIVSLPSPTEFAV